MMENYFSRLGGIIKIFNPANNIVFEDLSLLSRVTTAIILVQFKEFKKMLL